MTSEKTTQNLNAGLVQQTSENSLAVLDTSGKSVSFDKVVISLSSLESSGGSNLILINSIAELRQYEPTENGQMVQLTAYTAGTTVGGGLFIYDSSDTTSKEDYGLIIVTPKGARWKRDISDYNDVTVTYFGAIPDGKTDCLQAVTYMWNWSQEKFPYIGVKFPAGNFMISKFDISDKEVNHFRLVGDHVNSGYYPSTTLFSDKKNNEVMFTVKARHMVIAGLEIKGESTDSAPNTKGFYKNIIQAGQYVRVTSVHFINVGGRGLDMLDTLDCKIDQWYANNCSGTVIYANWSDNASGNWDHITAIELSNFNIQYNTSQPAIDLQRATQSLIWNGWIEHTDFPGNISNGQWIINTLNIETCTNPLQCHYTRIVNMQFGQQNGAGLDFSETGDTWDAISEYESGDVQIENHGVKINGSLNYGYLTSPYKMDNRTDNEKWFYIGELLHSQNAMQTRIRIVGSAFYSSMPSTQTGYTDRTAEGCADIYLQKNGDTTYIGTWTGQGSSPLTRVLVQPGTSSQKIKVYAKVAKYTGYCTPLIETNDIDRYGGGVHFRFYPAFTAATAEEIKVLDAAADNCFHQHWHGNSAVGFGFNNDAELLLKGKVLALSSFDTATQCLKILIDGKAYGLELKPLKS